jgi:Matrixin
VRSVWLRPALITVAALAVVVALAAVWPREEPGACVAPPGAEQQDVDPDDSPEAPWPRTAGQEVVVHFAVGGLPARYVGLVEQAAGIWGRSPCVEPVVVDRCPAGANCSTVVVRERSEDDDTDGESDGDDRDGVRRSTTITLYTALLDDESDNGALATIVHEMGHALGLVHRLDPGSVMNAETDDSTDPVPDATDYANLAVVYG